jgi:prepilin signal peptidase PulO-like enzyme (type II secretory pathway)
MILLHQYWLYFVIGLVFGSFGNVLICRLPKGESICGRSQCLHCKRYLSVFELVPVVSFLLLGGRCHTCYKEVSWRYPLVEIASGLLFVVSLITYPEYGFFYSIILWLLLVVALIDAAYQSIPDLLNIPFFVLAVILAFLIDQFDFIALLLGGGFFAVQWIVSRGRWVGSGDIILGAGIGALVGSISAMFHVLLFAYVIGALVAVCLLTIKYKSRKDHIAFGPFLALGTYIVLLLQYWNVVL